MSKSQEFIRIIICIVHAEGYTMVRNSRKAFLKEHFQRLRLLGPYFLPVGTNTDNENFSFGPLLCSFIQYILFIYAEATIQKFSLKMSLKIWNISQSEHEATLPLKSYESKYKIVRYRCFLRILKILWKLFSRSHLMIGFPSSQRIFDEAFPTKFL